MRTQVCDMLGIEYPILAFSHCRDVVAAVSNAGGFGVLGAVAHTPEQLEVDLNWIEEQTHGRPYGVDLLLICLQRSHAAVFPSAHRIPTRSDVSRAGAGGNRSPDEVR